MVCSHGRGKTNEYTNTHTYTHTHTHFLENNVKKSGIRLVKKKTHFTQIHQQGSRLQENNTFFQMLKVHTKMLVNYSSAAQIYVNNMYIFL